MSHVHMNFYTALRCLLGLGSREERLASAAVELATVLPDVVPSQARERFERLHRKLSRLNPRDDAEGAIHATVAHMNDETYSECAGEILDLYGELIRLETDSRQV
jgi:hypothetical protein